MRYISSPEMEQMVNLIIIPGKREPLESMCVTAWPTWRVGTAEREGFCPAYPYLL